jgi:hypothetical protein
MDPGDHERLVATRLLGSVAAELCRIAGGAHPTTGSRTSKRAPPSARLAAVMVPP